MHQNIIHKTIIGNTLSENVITNLDIVLPGTAVMVVIIAHKFNIARELGDCMSENNTPSN